MDGAITFEPSGVVPLAGVNDDSAADALADGLAASRLPVLEVSEAVISRAGASPSIGHRPEPEREASS